MIKIPVSFIQHRSPCFPQQRPNYIKFARVRSKSLVMLTNNISLLQVARKQKPLKDLMKLKPDLVGVLLWSHN